MVAMTIEEPELEEDRPLAIQDLDPLPDLGRRYEIDDGLLIVTPSPMAGHQRVVMRLSAALDAACPPDFEVFPGFGIAITPHQYRIPDIVVARAGEVSFDRSLTKTPPALVIEVASPSTAIYDRNRKKDVYASFGIRSYWIVRPDRQNPGIVAFELSRKSFRQVTEASGDEVFETSWPFPFETLPAKLVAEPGAGQAVVNN
jgi:Uma2 family endonuclease